MRALRASSSFRCTITSTWAVIYAPRVNPYRVHNDNNSSCPWFARLQVYSFRQARAEGDQAPSLTVRAAKTLRHIARGEGGIREQGGVEENKNRDEGVDKGRGAVSSAQLLDAVHDILGRADLTLTVEQGESLKQSLRHRGEVRFYGGALSSVCYPAVLVER